MTVNVLDPELPFLASQAAVELDAVLNGQQPAITAVKKLADRLQAAVNKSDPTQSARGLLADTATVTVLGQAVNLADEENQLTNLQELFFRTQQIADQLSAAATGRTDNKLEWARAFCLALSRCAAAYRKSFYDIRQPHPYRR